MAEVALDWDEISNAFLNNKGPEIVLALIGLLALSIAIVYVKHGETSNKYRTFMLLGLVVSIFMVYVMVTMKVAWPAVSLIIVAVACFALIIRPFRKIHFAVILSLMVLCVVYIFLGTLTGYLEVLSTGWPRIVVAFVAGGIFYAIASFAEAIIDLFGAILNAVPVLFVLGIICIVEAACLIYTGDTIYEVYLSNKQAIAQAIWLL